MAAGAWRSSTSPLALQGLREILVPSGLRGLPEFRDLPDHKEQPDFRDLPDRKGLLAQSALLVRPELLVPRDPLEQLDLPGLLALRASWDFLVRKDRRGRKVRKVLRDRLVPPHLEQAQIRQWLV